MSDDHEHTTFGGPSAQKTLGEKILGDRQLMPMPKLTAVPAAPAADACLALSYCGQTGKSKRTLRDCFACLEAYQRHQFEQIAITFEALSSAAQMPPEVQRVIATSALRMQTLRRVTVK